MYFPVVLEKRWDYTLFGVISFPKELESASSSELPDFHSATPGVMMYPSASRMLIHTANHLGKTVS